MPPPSSCCSAPVGRRSFLVVFPFFSYRPYLAYARQSVGQVPQGGLKVERNGGRSTSATPVRGTPPTKLIADLDARAKPGERLLVGPVDLRQTIYSDVFFYYLFPELTPATYFIEMDPGLANKEGTRLTGDVTSADWLILTRYWSGWIEPNTSTVFGDDRPNQAVEELFCLEGTYQNDLIRLYQPVRRRRGHRAVRGAVRAGVRLRRRGQCPGTAAPRWHQSVRPRAVRRVPCRLGTGRGVIAVQIASRRQTARGRWRIPENTNRRIGGDHTVCEPRRRPVSTARRPGRAWWRTAMPCMPGGHLRAHEPGPHDEHATRRVPSSAIAEALREPVEPGLRGAVDEVGLAHPLAGHATTARPAGRAPARGTAPATARPTDDRRRRS